MHFDGLVPHDPVHASSLDATARCLHPLGFTPSQSVPYLCRDSTIGIDWSLRCAFAETLTP